MADTKKKTIDNDIETFLKELERVRAEGDSSYDLAVVANDYLDGLCPITRVINEWKMEGRLTKNGKVKKGASYMYAPYKKK